MDLTNIIILKELCRQHGFYPSRDRGQNFLICRDVLDDMIQAADFKKDDVILEAGPGFGVLTIELAKRVKKVIAVEQDRILIKALEENLEKENIKNVEIIEGNVLHLITNCHSEQSEESQKARSFAPLRMTAENYRIVANLPYQITSHFLRIFLENDPKPKDMTLMVQKEVAERICAKPGEMSLLAVSVQFYGKPEIIRDVSKSCFWPEPKVDSAVLKIALSEQRRAESAEIGEKQFFKIVRNGFLHRRQKLVNNLSNSFHIEKKKLLEIFEKIGIVENTRAQELSLEQWVNLVKMIFK